MMLQLVFTVVLLVSSVPNADAINHERMEVRRRQQRRRVKGGDDINNPIPDTKDPFASDWTGSPFQNEPLAIPLKGESKSKNQPKISFDKLPNANTPPQQLDPKQSQIYTSQANFIDKTYKGDAIAKDKKKDTKSEKKSKDNMSKFNRTPKPVPAHRKPAPSPVKQETTSPHSPPRSPQICTITASSELLSIPELITKTPTRCCNSNQPYAVLITHAVRDDATASGFEIFWDSFYNDVDTYTKELGACFVMTGFDPTQLANNRTLDNVLVSANTVASNIATVPVIMTTDPTQDVQLVQTIRQISENPVGPNIGVFNAGYANIVIEAIVTGLDRLPFIGLLDDSDYGAEAARTTQVLLQGRTPKPLCFNPRPDLDFLGQRCEAYYNGLTNNTINPVEGIFCGSNTTAQDITDLITKGDINAVWAHVDCCSTVGQAVQKARQMGLNVIAGCQDADTTNGLINFVTAQPIELEAYNVATWSSFPVILSSRGIDGRSSQAFPGLQSLINTAIYSVLTL